MSDRAFSGKTAIVGIATSDFHALYDVDPERTSEELATHVIRDALADAGLTTRDVDGLVTGGTAFYEPVAYRTGLTDVRFIGNYPSAGRMCPAALMHAAMAVEHGLARCVVLFNSVVFRSRKTKFGYGESNWAGKGLLYDGVYGLASPGAQYSIAFTRYQHLYGGTEEQLGAVAVAFRKHARLNPAAVMQAPLSIDDYMSARYVAQPLRLPDYCLINDGAVAYIVTSAERARDLRQKPVYLGGTAERANFRQWYVDQDFWADACASMKRDLMAPLGVSNEDVDAMMVYDNFSPVVLWALEGFGFAPRGEALAWIQGGRIDLGGELPINTSGGMLSEAYLQGWNQHAESVRQLRGQAGARQVPDCKRILYVALSALPTASLLYCD
jgi:acetyl-CoA acetyltransferase